MTTASSQRRGFTLMETVIAIGVLAVLLSAFMAVFAPATAGIRRSISMQEADRLASTLERELTTWRPGASVAGGNTAFDKAFEWIINSANANATEVSEGMLFVYQYRADPTKMRTDGTLAPYEGNAASGTVGVDYVVQSMARPRSDTQFLEEDLRALEGRPYAVRLTQLVFDQTNGLVEGTPGQIKNPLPPNSVVASADQYEDAVIAFSAQFYDVQSTAVSYLTGANGFARAKLTKPVFTRSLAVRR